MDKILVTTKTVSCCGKDPLHGHPLIYLDVSSQGSASCPYCGCAFIYQEESH